MALALLYIVLKSFHLLQGAIPDLHKNCHSFYIVAAEGNLGDVKVLDWWKKHIEKVPLWSAACYQVLLCQPSSATLERVFNFLKSSFSDQQS